MFLAPPPGKLGSTSDRQRQYGELSVILPWSPRNTVLGDSETDCFAWPRIQEILIHDVSNTPTHLRSLMQRLLIHFSSSFVAQCFTFESLCYVVDHMLTKTEYEEFFAYVLPWMKRTVCHAENVFGNTRLPLLRQEYNAHLTFSHEEVVVLMCCAFFSLFPGRSERCKAFGSSRKKTRDHLRDRSEMGLSVLLASANWDRLLSFPVDPTGGTSHLSKIRCLLQYFFYNCRLAAAEGSAGSSTASAVEISRVCYAKFPNFPSSTAPLQPLTLRAHGLIEEDAGALQVDFANKVIGGGVLGRGCVQEEIRFVISPELLLSRLVCETLLDHESVLMSGCVQFSRYTGYSSTFQYAREVDQALTYNVSPQMQTSLTRRCQQGKCSTAPMSDVCVVAMDAVSFCRNGREKCDQYLPFWVMREMNKAFVAFRGTDARRAALQSARQGPVATGNWGCGAFGGDVELKLLIQWCAVSEAGRPLRYYVFDQTSLLTTFPPLQEKLVQEKWTVGHVVAGLLRYSAYRSTQRAGGMGLDSVFKFFLALPRNAAFEHGTTV